MGRRPNPLISEFFHRGAKLTDHSNRYQHTCKRCGEEFPKGRIDSLTSHLLRKCPYVTDEDRQWVFQQIQRAPNGRINRKPISANSLPPDARHEDLQTDRSPYEQHQQSALDTLAEVSRRHLDYSTPRTTDQTVENSPKNILSDVLAEQALIAELQNHVNGLSSTTRLEEASPSESTTALDSSPLVLAASAASRQLELDQGHNSNAKRTHQVVDPQLNDVNENRHPGLNSTGTVSHYDNDADTMTWTPTSINLTTQSFGGHHPNTRQSAAGFGLLQRPANSKKRGRFDDTRRKEVSEIRKQGACIRCRMLKKPCSGETPCSTCRSVESARLWKTKCLRTKLVDEFTLWSANLFNIRARSVVSAAISGRQHIAFPGQIQARLFTSSNSCLNLAARAYGGDVPSSDDMEAGDNETARILVLEEGGNLADSLETYVKQHVEDFIAAEASGFMKATLRSACEVVLAQRSEPMSKDSNDSSSKASRSCYNFQSQLLQNCVELWIFTRLLSSPEEFPWSFQCESSGDTEQEWKHSHIANEAPGSTVMDVPPASSNYRLITSQILGAIESHCNKLSKTTMNELERRLLQRQQVSRFATFLSAVILLSCVERMSGLFQQFDTDDATEEHYAHQHELANKRRSLESNITKEQATNNTTNVNDLHNHRDDSITWPLVQPPLSFWNQGQHFSELLVMLLRMRALPPKTVVRSDGALVVAHDYSPSTQPMQTDEQTQLASAWLDSLRLNASELLVRRDSAWPGRDEGVEAWDLKFVAQLLLPENMR